MNFPLDSVIVLDLTRLLPGALCTMFLADLGATVIKVEDPVAGDYARWTPPLIDGQGAFFRASNRNKQSIILDLKHPDGQAVLHRLAQRADVVVEGFRPGVTARLKVDAATLHAINPRLIYCSLSGWGQTGDYADLSGHDLNYVALSGLLGSMETPQVLGGQIADIGGAYSGALAIVSALFGRERSGQGAVIDIALFEAAAVFGMYQWVESAVGFSRGGQGSLTGGMAFYRVYWSADNQPMAFAPIEPKFWQNFCQAVNRPEWIPLHTDPAQQSHLIEQLTALFRSQTAQHWHDLLYHADCCFTLVTPPERLLDDPHIQARGMAGMEHGVPWMRTPIQLGAAVPRTPAPGYGQHTEQVLMQAGYTAEDVAALRQAGAVGRRT
ncbi:CaiB/BaiF CoA-transferase family protein [Aggregatilineales bacterium SYSU G02658]